MDENENENKNRIGAEVEVDVISTEVFVDCDTKRGSYVVNPEGETALEPKPESEPTERGCGAKAWTIAIAVLFMIGSFLQLTYGILKLIWWNSDNTSQNRNENGYSYYDYSYGLPDEVEKLINKCSPSAPVIIVSASLELMFSLLLLIGTLTKSPLALSVWLLTLGLTILGIANFSIFFTLMIYEHGPPLFLTILLIGSLLICVILTLCYLIVYFHRNELFAAAQTQILMRTETLEKCEGENNTENLESSENPSKEN